MYASNEDIHFVFKIKGLSAISSFRIALGVQNLDETPVGTFFRRSTFCTGRRNNYR